MELAHFEARHTSPCIMSRCVKFHPRLGRVEPALLVDYQGFIWIYIVAIFFLRKEEFLSAQYFMDFDGFNTHQIIMKIPHVHSFLIATQ